MMGWRRVPGPTETRTCQQGVDGYSGTKSVGISTYGGLGNVGTYNANGMSFADGLNDWCTGIDIPSGAYSEVWLLRFEDLGAPNQSWILPNDTPDLVRDILNAKSNLASAWTMRARPTVLG